MHQELFANDILKREALGTRMIEGGPVNDYLIKNCRPYHGENPEILHDEEEF